ncbi:MAG TPA: 2,3-bisphosphoglycerate-independent phosphoglycerate mutase [Alphaproteobacteria bacterium]|nr:2,3-bisphosphoglycerate-independent phosphoglycerate mutase [Alphaproteobacteria bacterium]
MTKPLILCILDGVGLSSEKSHNAVIEAKMPFFHKLLEKYPSSKLDASGPAVGLPDGVMGNSEVGHITIGSGRIINQFLRRFELEDWNKNQALSEFIDAVKKSKGVVHIIGLMSDGRVHSDINEIITIAKRIINSKLKIVVHFIADGRDTPPKSAEKYLDMLKDELPYEIVSTVMGRYYAMDRNNNLDRTEMAFNAIANGIAEFDEHYPEEAIINAYKRGETDEFIKPTIIRPPHHTEQKITDYPKITPNDGILFCNYRSDRARQILRELLKTNARMLCFSQYGEGLDESCPALLPDVPVKNTLGEILAANGKTQLRIAETEKYNHVTYFFDAEKDVNFNGEEKVLIPSPNVATFDLQPTMSAPEITKQLLSRLSKFDVVILNYANGDMVGHTGNEAETIKAMECLDEQLSLIVPAALELCGTVLVTADHGNAEKMWDDKNNVPWTAHTTNPVSFIVVSGEKHTVQNGGLSDIAPTILKLLNLPQPDDMTGKSLI